MKLLLTTADKLGMLKLPPNMARRHHPTAIQVSAELGAQMLRVSTSASEPDRSIANRPS
jgi:hypothetical protein